MTLSGIVHDVFVSYSSVDSDWVWNELIPRLEGEDFAICIDKRNFLAGKPIIDNIETAVNSSQRVLIVLTPDWLNNEWCHFEVLLGQTVDPSANRRKIIPLRLKNCNPPIHISMLTYIDFVNEAERDWRKLFHDLKKELSFFTESPSRVNPIHSAIKDGIMQVRGLVETVLLYLREDNMASKETISIAIIDMSKAMDLLRRIKLSAGRVKFNRVAHVKISILIERMSTIRADMRSVIVLYNDSGPKNDNKIVKAIEKIDNELVDVGISMQEVLTLVEKM